MTTRDRFNLLVVLSIALAVLSAAAFIAYHPYDTLFLASIITLTGAMIVGTGRRQ